MPAAPIEGTVCTYLVPLWGAGSDLTKNGKLNLDTPEARQPFQLYGRMKQAGVLPKNIAEIPTDRIRVDFQAGNVVFAQTWGYVWNRVENDAHRSGHAPEKAFTRSWTTLATQPRSPTRCQCPP